MMKMVGFRRLFLKNFLIALLWFVVNDESEDETDDANEEEDMVLEPNDLQITYSPTTEMAANETTPS